MKTRIGRRLVEGVDARFAWVQGQHLVGGRQGDPELAAVLADVARSVRSGRELEPTDDVRARGDPLWPWIEQQDRVACSSVTHTRRGWRRETASPCGSSPV